MPRKKTRRSKSPGNKSPPDALLEAMGALSLKRGRSSSPPASKRDRRGMRILAVNFLQAPAPVMPAMPEVVVVAVDKPVRQDGETAHEFRLRKAAFLAAKHSRGGTRKRR